MKKTGKILTSELREQLTREGYFLLVETEDHKICGLLPFMFTTGLVVDIDQFGYGRRYCYPNTESAVDGYVKWLANGTTFNDPQDDMWIKCKGDRGDYTNPLKK